MNKIILNLILGFCFLSVYSQNTQSFTRNFKTSSGIYGYVEIITNPTGFGTLSIQQSKTVVEGIKNFSGKDLSEFGMTFPFYCSNCFFYTDGTVSMQIRDVIGRSNGFFSKGGSINLSSGINRFVNWSSEIKEKHNEALKKYREGNYWERNGRVETLNIYNVEGGDFGNVTYAVEQYEKAQQTKELEEVNEREKQKSDSHLNDNTNQVDNSSDKSSDTKKSNTNVDNDTSSNKSTTSKSINQINDRAYILKNQANQLQQQGDLLGSAMIKNANPDVFSREDIIATNTGALVIGIADVIENGKKYTEAEIEKYTYDGTDEWHKRNVLQTNNRFIGYVGTYLESRDENFTKIYRVRNYDKKGKKDGFQLSFENLTIDDEKHLCIKIEKIEKPVTEVSYYKVLPNDGWLNEIDFELERSLLYYSRQDFKNALSKNTWSETKFYLNGRIRSVYEDYREDDNTGRLTSCIEYYSNGQVKFNFPFKLRSGYLAPNENYEGYYENGQLIFSFNTDKKGIPKNENIKIYDKNGNVIDVRQLNKKIIKKRKIVRHEFDGSQLFNYMINNSQL